MSTTRKSTSSRTIQPRGRKNKEKKGKRENTAFQNSHEPHKSGPHKIEIEAASREIEVFNRQRLREINKERAAALSRSALDRIGRPDAVLTVTFIRDRAMRRLNRDYRGVDRPTDVLSFAYHEGEAETIFDEKTHIGDVVISVETAERYAREYSLSFEREIEHLLIHGALHLAGYDHETDNGEMNKLERKLRRELLK